MNSFEELATYERQSPTIKMYVLEGSPINFYKLCVRICFMLNATVRSGYILTSCPEATRGLFRDGPRNFEPQSDDEDDTRAGTPSPKFPATSTGGRLATTYD
ncbi:hypothetical protein AVEN_121750-1 [Araneus ventricosus]|uniref:Uncharacterized protein n=1 Tax=Araneus ventricosus TaxID=182803 RepID=A0A4Y2TKY0_ARAVE|nr:hypothetical protein AVEN_121750-1 [Araneus ventricosus]